MKYILLRLLHKLLLFFKIYIIPTESSKKTTTNSKRRQEQNKELEILWFWKYWTKWRKLWCQPFKLIGCGYGVLRLHRIRHHSDDRLRGEDNSAWNLNRLRLHNLSNFLRVIASNISSSYSNYSGSQPSGVDPDGDRGLHRHCHRRLRRSVAEFVLA